MTAKTCANTPSLNTAKKLKPEMDVFSRQQAILDAAHAVGASVDVWGAPAKPRLSCEDMAKFKIEDCKVCPERDSCGDDTRDNRDKEAKNSS